MTQSTLIRYDEGERERGKVEEGERGWEREGERDGEGGGERRGKRKERLREDVDGVSVVHTDPAVFVRRM